MATRNTTLWETNRKQKVHTNNAQEVFDKLIDTEFVWAGLSWTARLIYRIEFEPLPDKQYRAIKYFHDKHFLLMKTNRYYKNWNTAKER